MIDRRVSVRKQNREAHARRFSEILREAMIARGLRQAGVARLLGTTQPNVSRWLNDGILPDAVHLAAIEEVFGLSLKEILT
jgi:transcriptional regulator with XRE-family HTH domain